MKTIIKLPEIPGCKEIDETNVEELKNENIHELTDMNVKYLKYIEQQPEARAHDLF